MNDQGMQTVLDYLTHVPAWYLATTDEHDGGQPRVRPFSFAAIENGRLWFSTSKDKDIYRELLANPKFELCSWWIGHGWLVMSGVADMTDAVSDEVRTAGFEHMVALGEGHDSPDDGRLTYFSVKSARARIDDIDGSSREIAWE
ncbi:pyridoxamine 5'-phosphate oxidase family protein [Slackia exigua]|uniref:pyridoxamine 5'-phosphate oxidase family protein n=1 Tax=Slackia exigua TaxID=84109 RepID=UPI0023F138E9|nr:pyridoxamine 5'-phosphate oxidase family protein [Slackia exigua]